MIVGINVAECETQPLWDRGAFRTAYRDLTEPLGAQWIGATVFDTDAGFTRGPFHYHDGVEEWMYVLSGEPVLRDHGGQRTLQPGSLVAFAAGPAGAHTYDGPGRVVMFSMGARGWGEAFTSVSLDADKIGGKPGVQFLRSSAVQTWDEPATETIPPAVGGPCPEVNLQTFPGGGSSLAQILHAQTWTPLLRDLAPGETTGAYHYDWCREHWALVISGAPTLRHPDGRDVLISDDIVCLPEGETGAHQFINENDIPARVLICTAPASGLSAAVEPDDDHYLLRVPGQTGYRFRLSDRLDDYWDGEPGARAE